MGADERTVLIANPSPDVYGSDLQMLQTAAALIAAGRRVLVTLPADGPLVERLKAVGVGVIFADYPVLRRSYLTPIGLVSLAGAVIGAAGRLRRLIKFTRPEVIYVNTITLPWWLLIARLCRVPAVCHVHEAEAKDAPIVRKMLAAPLQLATAVIANGQSAREVLLEAVPQLESKTQVIYNGVPTPDQPVEPAPRGATTRLLVVGRLSPRKATHIALEATAALRSRGYDVTLELCGSAFAGYEWYVAELQNRAQQEDLARAVIFSGYTSPIWPALQAADIVLAPSLGESLGNAVVEAQLSGRPVVATAVQGHLETVTDQQTGMLVPPDDAESLARAIARLIDDRELADRIAGAARSAATERFSTERYAREIVQALDVIAAREVVMVK